MEDEPFFDRILNKITEIVFYPVNIGGVDILPIVVWLIVAALFFTVYLGFLNIRGFAHAINLVRGRYSKPEDAGEVSHFQALATAVSGTVGLGNIAGVAVAITLGGPGATFWMILAGFLGMSTKLAECTLGVKYRKEHPDGTVSGGPMYYLRDGLAELGLRGLGKVLAAAFAVFCILGSLGGGNMFQANQATAQILAVTGNEGNTGLTWAIGIAFALAVGMVILGGIKSIARVTEKVVPFMAALYLLACLVVILANVEKVPGAFGDIVSGAFSPEGITGGVVGVLIVGFQRAAFSNEAGIGSASIAHSAVKTNEPSTEGHVALLEPFIDTIVICTMTALMIVISGVWEDGEGAEGVALTSSAFETVVPWFPNVLAVAVILFAFSTMISWSYYGMKATGYLFGDNQTAENVYKVVFCIFTVLGSVTALDAVLGFSDAAIFLMSVPNVIGLYILARVLRKELSQYRAKIANGEIQRVK
ncbi:alanine/glycine:cation symporter family protein [Nocardioides lacusdianchii]|uniref:alanine/glycine:cation symporter family protein n=1 Tax=Nocardioides lacusdianchii TaxID=2783664 RepID=UPI001CC94741|nr:alanine/glycine:cation symporter family protein [Nocardioides lacusdianchii]